MSRLPFEAFLALRYLRPRRTFVSVITVISIIGVLLGVAVLIVVISVMSGFDREWRARILGFNSHLKIYQEQGHHRTPLTNFVEVLNRVGAHPSVKGAAPFVTGQVLVKTQPPVGNPKVMAPMLLGIDPETEKTVSILSHSIKAGKYDVSRNGLLIGKEFAVGMDLSVGDRVVIYSPASIEKMERTRGQADAEAILPDEFTVRGIFDVGFNEFNQGFVITSLEASQRLYTLEEDTVHGLQVMLTDPFLAERVRIDLERSLGSNYQIITWVEERPELFNALAVEKNMMFFLLFFIMIVAGFGIVNCQITFVVQKTREIGILKALGATNGQVLCLFLSQSVVVAFLGVGCGLGLALLALRYRNEFLAFMNRMTGFELLPASIYQVYELPASLELSDVTIICGTAFITCVLAGLFPAWKASRLQPVEALRYE